MNPDSLLTLMLVAGGAALTLALTQVVIRSSVTGVALVVAAVVADYAGAPDPAIGVAGMSVYARDIIVTIVLVAAAARYLRLRRLTWAQRALLAVALIVAASLVRGIVAFETAAAVNEARNWLGVLAGALYCSTVAPQQRLLAQLGRVLAAGGVVLMLVALANWAGLAAGISLPEAQGARGLRVLGAGATFIVVQAAVLLAPAWARRGRSSVNARRLALVLFGTVLLLQHRTVWIAFAVTLLVMLVRNPALGRRVGAVVLVAGVGMAVLAVTVLNTDATELSSSAVDDQTFEWRLEGWRVLLFENGPETPGQVLFGQPFGTGFERKVGNSVVAYSPHSFYIEGYLRIGLVGMAAALGLFAALLRTLLSRPDSGREYATFTPGTLVNLLTLQLIFGFAYFMPTTSGIVLGMAVAVAGRRPVPEPLAPIAASETVPVRARTPVGAGRPG